MAADSHWCRTLKENPMSGLYTGVALAFALAALSSSVFLPWQEKDTMTVSSIRSHDDVSTRFELRSSERQGACSIVIGEGQGEKHTLRAGIGCAGVHPALAAARWWEERPDGSVAFLRPDGGIVAEFAIADGAAFESYNPLSPILVLLSDE